MTKHTPPKTIAYFKMDKQTKTPWFVYKDCLSIDVREEEKPFWNEIVRTINSHNDLLDACIMMLNICKGQNIDFPSMRFVEKAIAKAEGK